MSTLRVAYSNYYLNWQLGDGHPTNPVRAEIAVNLLQRIQPSLEILDPTRLDRNVLRSYAGQVHHADYIYRLLVENDCEEFATPNHVLSHAALMMFGGTVRLVQNLHARVWEPSVAFNPQGAKHHAMPGRANGFCALNDMAWAAHYITGLGMRVGYLDWDAHHGDGVEVMLAPNAGAATCSIHEYGIFPHTGLSDSRADAVWNFPLAAGSDDRALLTGVSHALHRLDDHGTQVLLLAAGADGLAGDPLTGLRYTQDGLLRAARMVGHWAANRRIPVIVGGAGGYLPHDETPMAWAGMVAMLQREFEAMAL